ncbi:MAG: very short patch repair endonuclease [Simkaniaceae bacterium]|nr:very short patch repair endonuclease [Simkaniaceae bacterium]
MTDPFDAESRSRVMSSIKGRDTRPEIHIRKALFARGFRYTLHNPRLPGKPDMIFPKYKAVLFIHGCFWHRHTCKYGALPSTNREFWRKKLTENAERDAKQITLLEQSGWRTKVIWTCMLRGRRFPDGTNVIADIADWLTE